MDEPLLSVRGLSVHFLTGVGVVEAVDGVSYDVRRGETVAVVGESGCGKSVTALALLGLVPSPPGKVVGGEIRLEGESLLDATPERLREIRGDSVAMIFQEPMTSLNPVFTVGDQIAEVLAVHRDMPGDVARTEVIRLLALVGIAAPEQRVDEYPHQLSGGMRQRVMIAMALACGPKLLIADEPTTALDVTVQAQVLELLARLQRVLGMAILLITHDLGVVAETAHRVVVMYAGRVVEQGTATDVFARPQHPYTAGLFRSLPRLDTDEALRPIEGSVPDALRFPSGCRFHPRCPYAMPVCREKTPLLAPRGTAGEPHLSACFYVDEHPEADLFPFAAPEAT
ncbi:MAG TPA: ABC transporter ATP-binding protein [Polyangiaceae bacterium]|jgi:oligopeptide/dipeptide ABC transporter ATP-binding protein|nr:ABC transporter ATP-binding protein [Polyangiaceae bacterium]